jgi:hypothetical protein
VMKYTPETFWPWVMFMRLGNLTEYFLSWVKGSGASVVVLGDLIGPGWGRPESIRGHKRYLGRSRVLGFVLLSRSDGQP